MTKFEFKLDDKAYTVKADAPQVYAVRRYTPPTPLQGPTHWQILNASGASVGNGFDLDSDDEEEVVAQAKEELRKYFETS